MATVVPPTPPIPPSIDSIMAKLKTFMSAGLPAIVADLEAEVTSLKAQAAQPEALAQLDGLVDQLIAGFTAADPGKQPGAP